MLNHCKGRCKVTGQNNYVNNRPGVAEAVLQIPLWKYLQNTFTPNP